MFEYENELVTWQFIIINVYIHLSCINAGGLCTAIYMPSCDYSYCLQCKHVVYMALTCHLVFIKKHATAMEDLVLWLQLQSTMQSCS